MKTTYSVPSAKWKKSFYFILYVYFIWWIAMKNTLFYEIQYESVYWTESESV